MEISFSITCLARNSKGESKVAVVACGVRDGLVFDSMIIFSDYVAVPAADESVSVQEYVNKVIVRATAAITEEVMESGYTAPVELMLVKNKRK